MKWKACSVQLLQSLIFFLYRPRFVLLSSVDILAFIIVSGFVVDNVPWFELYIVTGQQNNCYFVKPVIAFFLSVVSVVVAVVFKQLFFTILVPLLFFLSLIVCVTSFHSCTCVTRVTSSQLPPLQQYWVHKWHVVFFHLTTTYSTHFLPVSELLELS